MGTQKPVLTERDLTALNNALEQIASNMTLHVNESLSIAHGINATIANFYDSAGDQWGNVVVIFEFGSPPNVTRLYVPAQITSLGPARTTNGINSSGSPTGSFLSPGVPLTLKPLVTELTTEAVNQAIIYDNMLLSHTNTVFSDTGADQCHGGRTYTVGSVTDSLGHTVSRKYISLGINGTTWKIPADEYWNSGSGFGPPQLMRGINLVADRTTKVNTAASKQPKPQLCGFWLTSPTGGSTPYTVTWEINYNTDGSAVQWNVMGNATPGFHLATTTKTVYYDISTTGLIVLQAWEGHDGGYRQQATIRAKISNDAGYVYTNYCRMYSSEPKEDDCWFDEIFGTDWFTDIEANNADSWQETIPGSPPLQP